MFSFEANARVDGALPPGEAAILPSCLLSAQSPWNINTGNGSSFPLKHFWYFAFYFFLLENKHYIFSSYCWNIEMTSHKQYILKKRKGLYIRFIFTSRNERFLPHLRYPDINLTCSRPWRERWDRPTIRPVVGYGSSLHPITWRITMRSFTKKNMN